MLEVLHVKLKLSMLCSRAGRSLARVVVQAQQLGFSSQSGSSSSELAAFWQGLLQPPPQPKPGDGSSKGSEANVDAAKARQLLSDHFRLFKGGTLPGGTLPEDVHQSLVEFYRRGLPRSARPWFLHLLTQELGTQVKEVQAAVAQWQSALAQQPGARGGAADTGARGAARPVQLRRTQPSTDGTWLPGSPTSPAPESSPAAPAEASQQLLQAQQLQRAADRLRMATQPLYTHLFQPISQEPEGIRFLVDLRADALAAAASAPPATAPPLRALAEHLRQALAVWFTPGLLRCERLTWSGCSAELVEKVAQYEAVHPVAGWRDLRRRLGEDRRVYAFFHPCLPGEPLVILHTALLPGGAAARVREVLPPLGSIPQAATEAAGGEASAPASAPGPQQQGIPHLQHHSELPAEHQQPSSSAQGKGSQAGTAGEEEGLPRIPLASRSGSGPAGTGTGGGGAAALTPPRTALFYSISSTQPGLAGVDLGHFLIQQVAEKIQSEFPSIQRLATLSPLPGFRTWLLARLAQESLAWAREQGQQAGVGQASSISAAVDGEEEPGQGSQGSDPGDDGPAIPFLPGSGTPVPPLITQKESQALLQLMAGSQQGSSTGAAPVLLPHERDAVQATGGGPHAVLGLLLGSNSSSGSSGSAGSVARSVGGRWMEPGTREVVEPLLRPLLLRAAARYLLLERRRSLALDPVAHFHLRNGAVAWRLCWAADTSARGLDRSFGLMINYRYDLTSVYTNNRQYLMDHAVMASPQLVGLLQAEGCLGSL